VLAWYTVGPAGALYLSTADAQPAFDTLAERLDRWIGVQERGRGVVRPSARPIVLWQPPVMLRLWPPPSRPRRAEERYAVDAGNLLGYTTDPYDADSLADLLADPAWAVDYALVPEAEHATLRDEHGEYSYVNCFYALAWRGA
jgi:hypothetical protein